MSTYFRLFFLALLTLSVGAPPLAAHKACKIAKTIVLDETDDPYYHTQTGRGGLGYTRVTENTLTQALFAGGFIDAVSTTATTSGGWAAQGVSRLHILYEVIHSENGPTSVIAECKAVGKHTASGSWNGGLHGWLVYLFYTTAESVVFNDPFVLTPTGGPCKVGDETPPWGQIGLRIPLGGSSSPSVTGSLPIPVAGQQPPSTCRAIDSEWGRREIRPQVESLEFFSYMGVSGSVVGPGLLSGYSIGRGRLITEAHDVDVTGYVHCLTHRIRLRYHYGGHGPIKSDG